jgi:MtN3 and saliva related transmembrane protein
MPGLAAGPSENAVLRSAPVDVSVGIVGERFFRYVGCNVEDMREVLGWLSSLILLITILAQIRKQWRERTGHGVSGFLFVGQTAASLGFTVYSALVGNWVFTVTNGLMLLSAITGWYITARFKRKRSASQDGAPDAELPRPTLAKPSCERRESLAGS